MRNIIVTAVAAVSFAAAAYALPADLVVVSDKEVRPDEAAAFYYLGTCAAGYLYNGSSAAAGRAAPYRVLDRDAQLKDYYIVWAPDWVGVTPQAFAQLGTSVRLSEYEILVGLEHGLGPGALRAVDHRIELIKLEPVTPVDWRYDGEAPPTKKDPRIEAAVNTITEAEYAGYIKRLQDFRTRYTFTEGCEGAGNYIRNLLAAQNLDATLFAFPCSYFSVGHYPSADGNIYLEEDHCILRRSKDGGGSWDNVLPACVNGLAAVSWVDGGTGFVAGYNNALAKTRDGGDTWEKLGFGRGHPGWRYVPYASYFLTEKLGWLGGAAGSPNEGYAGFLIKTSDGGLTWSEQQLPEHFRPGAIHFYNAKLGWAANSYTNFEPTFIYTDDGGSTWRPCTDPYSGIAYGIDLAAVGGKEAWAAGPMGRLLHTTDGLNWTYVSVPVSGPFNNVEFPNRYYGYAGGSTLIATDDGGVTWREVAGAPEMEYELLAFADRLNGVAGCRTGEDFYRTDDGCKTFADVSAGVQMSADNVIGERRGTERPDEIVIIGGHYDSISDARPWDCPGAEDNASGVACAIAAARAFRNVNFKRTVRFMAFGDEEAGLNGSTAYANECAEKGENIVAVLNADMVSYDEEEGARDDISVAHDQYVWLFDYLKGVGKLYGNKLVYDPVESIGSDQISFWNAGYAALGVIEGGVGVGGVVGYPYIHTTEDTLDKLQPAFGARCARDLAATLAHLAGVAGTFPDPPPPGTVAVPFTRPFAVYPNPYCYATCGGGVSFVGLKAPATVELYDLAGRRIGREEVAAGCDECVWRPARPGGEALAPGVYLYRVEGQEQRKAGKVVIAR